MTRLGIVSDSHDHGVWLERYLKLCRREKYDAVFHLGDYDSDARWLEKRLDTPVIAVAGNCDMFSDRPRMARISFGPQPPFRTTPSSSASSISSADAGMVSRVSREY